MGVLSLIINGNENAIKELENIDEDYFRIEDTKRLFLIIKEKIADSSNGTDALKYPLEIEETAIKHDGVKKLYHFIVFAGSKKTGDEPASREIFINLKKLYLSDRIEKARKETIKIIDNIKSLDSSNKDDIAERKNDLEKEQDKFYRMLIEFEKEKMKLNAQN